MAIDDWMPALASRLGTVDGVEQVHTHLDLPGSLLVFPCVVLLPLEGDCLYSAGGVNISFHQVQATLYVSAQILPEAYALAVPMIARVRDALAGGMTLGGLVAHVLPSAAGRFYQGPGSLRYADKDHLGIVFRLEVKEHETVTVSA